MHRFRGSAAPRSKQRYMPPSPRFWLKLLAQPDNEFVLTFGVVLLLPLQRIVPLTCCSLILGVRSRSFGNAGKLPSQIDQERAVKHVDGWRASYSYAVADSHAHKKPRCAEMEGRAQQSTTVSGAQPSSRDVAARPGPAPFLSDDQISKAVSMRTALVRTRSCPSLSRACRHESRRSARVAVELPADRLKAQTRDEERVRSDTRCSVSRTAGTRFVLTRQHYDTSA